MNWQSAAADITPSVVKIETPSMGGTGFLYMYNDTKEFCCIATALHVISEAFKWEQPIRIVHQVSRKSIYLKETDRIVFPDLETDSAVIFFPRRDIPFPDNTLKMFPSSSVLPIGQEVACLGFPAIEPSTLCLFSGNISAHQQIEKSYIIDGVSIHGLSGGPVFCLSEAPIFTPQVIGIVSAYKVNRTTGEALPGLLYAHDVSHFYNTIKQINSFDDARRRQEEIAQKSKEKPSAPPSEPLPHD